jgi:hypothetical protein
MGIIAMLGSFSVIVILFLLKTLSIRKKAAVIESQPDQLAE